MIYLSGCVSVIFTFHPMHLYSIHLLNDFPNPISLTLYYIKRLCVQIRYLVCNLVNLLYEVLCDFVEKHLGLHSWFRM